MALALLLPAAAPAQPAPNRIYALEGATARLPVPAGAAWEVRDEAGRVLPAACVTASCRGAVGPDGAIVGAAWTSIAQIDGTVEVLTPVTGPLGFVDLRVPDGPVEYEVVLGGASATASSDAPEVRVVLRAPERR